MAHGGRVPRTRQAMATAEAQGTRSAERQLAPEARKVARKQRKQAARAAKRQSGAAVGRKECGSCQKPGCEELIRCLSAEWEGWRLVCGSCWKRVSGGRPLAVSEWLSHLRPCSTLGRLFFSQQAITKAIMLEFVIASAGGVAVFSTVHMG